MDSVRIEKQRRTLDEIKKRLSILSKQWTEGQLSSVVQREMTKLTIGMIQNGEKGVREG